MSKARPTLSITLLLVFLAPILVLGASPAAVAENGQTNDHAVFLLILFVSLALGISFMCSVAEAVLLSITPTYIQNQTESRPRWGKMIARLRQEKVDRSLAAILTMNTIAHTVGAIEAGVQSAAVFGSTWVGVFSAIMTLAILFFSEIIPKTLGTVYWPQLVRVTAAYIRTLIVLLYPLVVASELITRLITRGKPIQRLSRDEFIAMAGVGEKTGSIDQHESRIIRNLLLLRSLKVTDIMTPRTVIFALPSNMPVADAQTAIQHSAFSRIPIYGADIDEIHGFVLKDEILATSPEDAEEKALENLKRELQAVPETLLLPALLKFLLDERHHLVLVVDEFGGTRGLVSLEDVMETLLGIEIVDELDDVTDMQALARQQWSTRIKALGLDLPDDLKS